jgi:hypothetical protein
MSATRVRGYMLNIKWGTKMIRGLETTGLKIKPNFEDIDLKENSGNVIQSFVDYDMSMTFSGKTYERDSGEGSSYEDFETLRAALAAGAQVAFVYGRFVSGEKIASGTGVLTDYSEDGNSKDTGTFSASIQVIKGSVTFGVTP